MTKIMFTIVGIVALWCGVLVYIVTEPRSPQYKATIYPQKTMFKPLYSQSIRVNGYQYYITKFVDLQTGDTIILSK